MENIRYFGIAFDKFEVLDFTTDFLAGVRANYFNSGLQVQKDKAVQHLNKVAYFFNYYFEKGFSADWVLKKNARLVQESEITNEEKYCIKTYSDDEFVYKKTYFDNEHNWIKTEYFSSNSDAPVCCLKNTVTQGQNVIKKISYIDGIEQITYLFPKLDVPEDRDYSVLAYTDMGFVYFNSVPNKVVVSENNADSVLGFSFKIENFSSENNSKDYSIKNAEYLDYNSNEEQLYLQEDIAEFDTELVETVSEIPEEIAVADTQEENASEPETVEVIEYFTDEVIENITVSEFNETPDSVINSGSEEYNYYGETLNGKRHGFGRTVTPVGKTAYEGSYFDDKRNGFGSFYCKNGDINYLGNWENNNRQGFGVGFRNTDFTAHIGKWSKNTPDGIGARFNRNGDFLFLGEFNSGKKQGIGISYDENAGFIISKFDEDKVVSSHLLNDILPDVE